MVVCHLRGEVEEVLWGVAQLWCNRFIVDNTAD